MEYDAEAPKTLVQQLEAMRDEAPKPKGDAGELVVFVVRALKLAADQGTPEATREILAEVERQLTAGDKPAPSSSAPSSAPTSGGR